MKKAKGIEVKSLTSDFLALCYKRNGIQPESKKKIEVTLPQQPQLTQKGFLKERAE